MITLNMNYDWGWPLKIIHSVPGASGKTLCIFHQNDNEQTFLLDIFPLTMYSHLKANMWKSTKTSMKNSSLLNIPERAPALLALMLLEAFALCAIRECMPKEKMKHHAFLAQIKLTRPMKVQISAMYDAKMGMHPTHIQTLYSAILVLRERIPYLVFRSVNFALKVLILLIMPQVVANHALLIRPLGT